jgi:hypothetical protein
MIQGIDVSRAKAIAINDVEIAVLDYATAATLHRLNLGLRRRKDEGERGFLIEPKSGRWLGSKSQEHAGGDAPSHSMKDTPQRIVPMVEDRKNTLLLRPAGTGFPSIEMAAVIQYALLRGIEMAFQLEPGEILAEPMPDRLDRNATLFYEASEGGAGVLGQLVKEGDGLARVAAHALKILHFERRGERWEPETSGDANSPKPCVTACYRCLLAYTNQPDHPLLKRRDKEALRFLCALAESRTVVASRPEMPAPAQSADTEPAAIDQFLALLKKRGVPDPRVKPTGNGW